MATSFSRRDITLANWRAHPFNTHSFQNVAEFVPSVDVCQPSALETFGDLTALDGLRLDHRALGKVSVADFLNATHGDVFAVMKDGEFVADWAAPHAHHAAPHLVFSVTKSVTGMLAGIAADEGKLDPQAPVAQYVPVPAACAYADASVRDLLDMTVRLDFVEDYLKADGPFGRYRQAMLWNPQMVGAPRETMQEVLSAMPRSDGAHGEIFYYASPNTDMLGLVIEAATGQRYHEFLSQRLWQPMGARGAARMTVDRVGAARAAGGLSITARDLARLGDLVMNDGIAGDGQRLIPAAWIADIRQNGNREAWVNGSFAHFFPQGRYRSCWYIAGDDRGCFAADGIHGQRLWVDPVSRVVAVKLSSHPLPSDDDATLGDFAALAQIAKSL